jgi:hypothetical protein
MATTKAYISITDANYLFKELKKLEPAIYKDLKANIRSDVQPMQKAVKQGIPGNAPLRGIAGNKIGRLRWGEGKPAKSVLISQKSPRKPRSDGKPVAAFVALRVASAATVLTDMAGASMKYVGKRPLAKGNGNYSAIVPSGKYKGQMGYKYTYRNGVVAGRIHANTGKQGRGLIRGLDARGGKASRWVWKNAEKQLPATVNNVQQTMNKTMAQMNRTMG